MPRRQSHVQTVQQKPHRPVRDRVIDAAEKLFFAHGTRAISIAQIAHLADTNSDTVLHYFGSKDSLVVDYLQEQGKRNDLLWTEMGDDYRGDPSGQLGAWIRVYALSATEKYAQGCELTKVSFELADLTHHPARLLIKERKLAERDRIARLCGDAGYSEPQVLADKLLMLSEGAEVAALTIGEEGPGIHFVKAAEALLAAHTEARGTCRSTAEVSHA